MTILVIGSFMMDQVVTAPRAPKNGETIIGSNIDIIPGGKGANQAVAAARLGAKVVMAGRVGNDQYGRIFLKALKKEGVNTNNIVVDEVASTGIGFVTKEVNGDNRIIVILGANLNYCTEDLQMINISEEKIDMVMFQLEMDYELTKEAIDAFSRKGIPILLNPAPARKLPKELLSQVTYLTPNESELELLTNRTINSIESAIEAANELLKNGVENVIVTLGDKGVLIVNESIVQVISGYKVNVVDTVAAGDSFNGALAVAISNGGNLIDAVEYSNVVGALTVMKHGAIPSLPNVDEVNEFIENYKVTFKY